jgi:hypothetical protein
MSERERRSDGGEEGDTYRKPDRGRDTETEA